MSNEKTTTKAYGAATSKTIRALLNPNYNPMTNIPVAACPRCGGWTGYGGMSQYRNNVETRTIGRTGCVCGMRNKAKAQAQRGAS